MFWDKYTSLCKNSDTTPTTVAKKLGVGSSTVTGWKNGSLPNGEILLKIADYFNVSTEYLLTDDEVSIRVKNKKSIFASLKSLPQRWYSIRHGETLSDEEVTKIARYLNCSLSFLYSDSLDYKPLRDVDQMVLFDISTLSLILGILDRAADSADLRSFQTQISRIILYWIDVYYKKEKYLLSFSSEDRKKIRSVSIEKLEYLYNGLYSDSLRVDHTFEYGLNFTEFDCLREGLGLSFEYMLTGIEKNVKDLYDELKRENEELKLRLNN